MAARYMDHTEGVAGHIIDGTKAFPLLERPGIEEGSYVGWTTEPLPCVMSTDPGQVLYRLRIPIPDRHYGYPFGRNFNWSNEEVDVIYHWVAQPYVRPTRDNVLPFLSLEVKTEATGGVLYVAENQAAGSGVHMVSSQRWLQSQAFPEKALEPADAIAFVGAVSPRSANFYIVWYSDRKTHYIMSKILTVSFMDISHIQRCRDLMTNICDFALGHRLDSIRAALSRLYPYPPHWKNARPASAPFSDDGVSDKGSQSNKSRRGGH